MFVRRNFRNSCRQTEVKCNVLSFSIENGMEKSIHFIREDVPIAISTLIWFYFYNCTSFNVISKCDDLFHIILTRWRLVPQMKLRSLHSSIFQCNRFAIFFSLVIIVQLSFSECRALFQQHQKSSGENGEKSRWKNKTTKYMRCSFEYASV